MVSLSPERADEESSRRLTLGQDGVVDRLGRGSSVAHVVSSYLTSSERAVSRERGEWTTDRKRRCNTAQAATSRRITQLELEDIHFGTLADCQTAFSTASKDWIRRAPPSSTKVQCPSRPLPLLGLPTWSPQRRHRAHPSVPPTLSSETLCCKFPSSARVARTSTDSEIDVRLSCHPFLVRQVSRWLLPARYGR